MYYIAYILALSLGFFFPIHLAASAAGISVYTYCDLVSLIVTVGASYLLVAAGTSSFNFFSNEKHLELWGNLCLKMGFIGFLMGMISILAGWDGDSDIWMLGVSLAIACCPVLYGLIFKYMIIIPWVTCKRNCKSSESSEE